MTGPTASLPAPQLPWPRLRGLCNLAVLLAFAGLVTLRGPLSPGSAGALLGLLGLALLLRERRLEREDLHIATLLMVLPLYVAANMALTGWDATQLDKPGRLVLGFLVYFAISRVGVNSIWLQAGSLAGALAAAVLAGWQVMVLGEARASGMMNAIPFGNGALLLGFCAAAIWLTTPAARRSRGLGAATLLALAAALYASFASGSRGGWVAIPFLLWVLSLGVSGLRPGLRAAIAVTALALLAAAVAALPALGARSLAEIDNLRQLWAASRGEAAAMHLSSIGTRLHLYRVGLDAFLAHPVFGIGYAQLPDWLAAGVDAGTVNPGVTHYTHLHSALVDSSARGGILGLAALGMLVLGLARHFHRHLAATDAEARGFALVGLLAIVGAALFSLTNVFFPAIVGTNILVMTLAVPAGALAYRLRRPAIDGAGS